MQKMLQQKSVKYIALPIAMLGLVAALALTSVDKVSAFGGENHENRISEFAAVLADKFGLDKAQVEETITQYHEQEMQTMHQEMQNKMEERLQSAVAAGSLTESQMQAILEKQDEMHERLEELRDQDLSPEDMRELRADIHEEMQLWAEEEGIDFDVFLKFGGDFMSGGPKRHTGGF